jgi:hypothetical protein
LLLTCQYTACLARCWLPGSATSRQLMRRWSLRPMWWASRDPYPTLQRLAPLMQLPGPANRFEAGLALILDGIEARIANHVR